MISESQSPLLALPDELLLQVSSHLDGHDVVPFSSACKKLRSLIPDFEKQFWEKHDKVSRIYQTLFLRNFIKTSMNLSEFNLAPRWIENIRLISTCRESELIDADHEESEYELRLLCLGTIVIFNGRKYIESRKIFDLSELKISFQQLIFLGTSPSQDNKYPLFWNIVRRILEILMIPNYLEMSAESPETLDEYLTYVEYRTNPNNVMRDCAFDHCVNLVPYLSPHQKTRLINIILSAMKDKGLEPSSSAKKILIFHKKLLSKDQIKNIEECYPNIFKEPCVKIILDEKNIMHCKERLLKGIMQTDYQCKFNSLINNNLEYCWNHLDTEQQELILQTIIDCMEKTICDEFCPLRLFYFAWPYFNKAQRQAASCAMPAILEKYGRSVLGASPLIWDYLDISQKEVIFKKLVSTIECHASDETWHIVCTELWKKFDRSQRETAWKELHTYLQKIFTTFFEAFLKEYPLILASSHSIFHSVDSSDKSDSDSSHIEDNPLSSILIAEMS